MHDNRIWSTMDQHRQYRCYQCCFSQLQYLLADSPFTTSLHLISAFKWIHGIYMLPEGKELFDTLLAKARLKVEHCIGLL